MLTRFYLGEVISTAFPLPSRLVIITIGTQLTTPALPKLSPVLASEKGVPFGSQSLTTHFSVLSVQKGAQNSVVSEPGKCIVHLESLTPGTNIRKEAGEKQIFKDPLQIIKESQHSLCRSPLLKELQSETLSQNKEITSQDLTSPY